MLERLGTTFILLVVCVQISNIKAVCVCAHKFAATQIFNLSRIT